MQFHSRKIQFLSEEILPKNFGQSTTKKNLISISGDYNIKYHISRSTRINGTTGGTDTGNIHKPLGQIQTSK
jgi:hypothetical protein